MRLLNDELARNILADDLINFTQVAVKFYEGYEGDTRTASDKAKALRNITLRSKKMSDKTLERLTSVLCRLYEKMTDDIFL